MRPTRRQLMAVMGRRQHFACALIVLVTFAPSFALSAEAAPSPATRTVGPQSPVQSQDRPEAASDEESSNPLARARSMGYLASPDEAIAEYEKVLEGSPTPRIVQEAQMGIASLEFAEGNLDKAREIFRDVLYQKPDWDLLKEATYRLKELDRRIAWSRAPAARVAECGVRALREVLRVRGKTVPLESVAARVKSTLGTASFADLRSAAEAFGLAAVGARLTYHELEALPMPFIAHLDPGHFVVVESAEGGSLRVVDPDLPGHTLSPQRFRELWSGSVLLFPDDGASASKVARLSVEEMQQVRGGHHLHGHNFGDASSNPASPFDGGSSSPDPCAGSGLPRLQVNLSNFNLVVQDTDFTYSGLGPSVFLQRTYNADDASEGVFGRSWSFNYGVAIEEQEGGSVNVRRESGKEDFFPLVGCTSGTCTYSPPIWIHDELIKNPDGTFELHVKQTRLIQRFDATGRLVSIEDRNGNAVNLGYDAGGLLTTVTDAAARVTTFTYDANNRVSRVVDPLGRGVTFTYDASGNLIGDVDMAGNVVAYTYDTNSYMSSVTTPAGTWNIANVPYDDPTFGLVVQSITDPLGHTTTYSTPGLVVVDVEDPNGIVWQYYPTGEGQLGSMTDPLGNSTQFSYNGAGDLTRVTDALGNATRFSWDARGNLTRITDPLGHWLDLTYDGDDNLTQLVDPLSNTYDYLYDTHDNLTQITDAAGGVTVLGYDGLGELTSISDARAKTTTLSYDAQGNLETMSTPLGKQTLYTYDGIGRPTSVITPRGVTRSFQWDGIDRLTKVTYPDASEVAFTYGCCQLQSVTGPNGTLSFTYDGANRPLSYTDVWGNTIGYGLDPGGRLTELTYPDGKSVSYGYDDAGRLTQVTDWLSNTTTYGYDALGRLTRTDLANGSVALQSYDTASRLTALTNLAPDGSVISRYEYIYDALGNRTHVEQYEPVPPSIPDETVAYQNDDDNRLLTANATVYDYDDDGDLISKTEGSDVTAYDYDDEGRLIQVSGGAQTTQYLYDDLGTRVGKVHDSTQTRNVINPLSGLSQLLVETDSAGNSLRYYVYGLGLNSMVTATGASYSYHYDALGSTVVITNSSGAVTSRYGYRPYGRLLDGTTSSLVNSFQFVGRLGVSHDLEKLIGMRTREYEAGIGRFTTRDPLLVLGPGSYPYADDNPVRLVDPLGEQVFVALGAIVVEEVLPALYVAATDCAYSAVCRSVVISLILGKSDGSPPTSIEDIEAGIAGSLAAGARQLVIKWIGALREFRARRPSISNRPTTPCGKVHSRYLEHLLTGSNWIVAN